MITDEQKDLLLQQYYDRGILKREIRSYEVSLWTLQDDFMTVLKWSDVGQKGRIENPMLTLNVDGTQRFTFSIPMYYRVNGVLTENPNWYTVKSGALIMGLRKIKIIFNKGSEYNATTTEEQAKIRSENTFELLITKVTETHEEDHLTCDVECEGLAFHELGKIGYKLNLGQDEFILDKTEWDEWEDDPNDDLHQRYWKKYNNEKCTTEPKNNIQYWCEEGCHLTRVPSDSNLIEASKWYYDIQMNWRSFGYNTLRQSDIIYEEEYVSSWNNDLTPNTQETYREKLRPVEAHESNIYNITQTIAETFGVYCKYIYGYDENYHITSRKIIFYNNYFTEDNLMSFIYPYTTNEVSREMDATDVVTKMFVRSQTNDAVVGGEVNIIDSPANGMREDYLLNFDYLYTIGAITKEQYNEIPKYQVDIRNLNVELESLNAQILAQEQIKIDQSALETVYENSVILDGERLNYNSELYSKLADADGTRDQYFSRMPANPYTTYVHKDNKGRYYIVLNSEDKGINPDTIHIFRFFNSAKCLFKSEISNANFTVVSDEYGTPKEITLSPFSESFTLNPGFIEFNTETWSSQTSTENDPTSQTTSNSLLVYLVYKYQPILYFDKVNQIWLAKQTQDQTNLDQARAALKAAETKLKTLNVQYEAKLAQKNELIAKFERMMGAALREGYWQPEDYNDYGDNKSDTAVLNSNFNEGAITSNPHISNMDKDIVAVWDNQLFDGENKNYYEESVLRTRVYYPCIQIDSTLMTKLSTWLRAGKTPSFVFNNNYFKTLDTNKGEETLIENVTIFSLGSQMQLGFVAPASGSTQTVIPVLILTGTDSMTEDQIAFMCRASTQAQNGGNPCLGIATTAITDNVARVTLDEDYADISSKFLASPQNYITVYPRVRICSTELNTSSVVISYNNKLLTDFEDYSILSRNVVSGVQTKTATFEYIVAIKPIVLFKEGSLTETFNVVYTLSNAATCIYLDALQVMTDSSKPRASYTVNVNILNVDYANTLYKNLTQLIMINDTELKFENTFGYISQLELNLDAPWEDKIEVKNYKTKFEDLFTTIVASSETMRQNAGPYNAAANGMIPLNQEALIKMISDNTTILQGYLDAGYDSSAHIKAVLADIFTEAGAILATANNALNDVHSVTLKNASILNGFLENVSTELTPKVFNSKDQPKTFKVGDIWNETDDHGKVIGRYVATSSSDDSSSGFTKTYDGTLAQIKGAALNADAATGRVEILAKNQIDIKSGGNIYIAANETVDIVGNKSVNIGGTKINIGSTAVIDPNSVTPLNFGGINLVAAKYDLIDSSISDQILSKVLISPLEISMASAKILMRTTSSAISMDPDNGIWMGSRAGIQLYAGEVTFTENDDGTFEASGTGANVELLPEHILLGVSNVTNSNTTAIKMTDEYIILAAGGQLHHDAWIANHSYSVDDVITYRSIIYKCKTAHTSGDSFDSAKWNEYDADKDFEVTGNVSSLIGAKFTKDSIGFATPIIEQNIVTGVNAILMNNKGITLGSGNFNLDVDTNTLRSNGSYVRIASSGIDIGSSGYLYINTTNFKLNSAATSEDSLLLGLYGNNGTTKALEYTQDGKLYIHGDIINQYMAFINSNNYQIDGTPYNPGIYTTNKSINGTDKAFSYKASGDSTAQAYYAWQYNNRTYYCKHNTGSSVRAGDAGTILQYKKITNAVAPKYEPKAVVGYGPNNEYTYLTYYIVDANKNIVKDSSNNDIKYDGSTNPNPPSAYPNWYAKIPTNQRASLVNYYETETRELEEVTLDPNIELTRTLNVTFSVIAQSGLTTISTGRIGNFYVSPQGFIGGVITSSNVTNTNLNGCMIENQFSTGYYGRCFYDYTFNRDTGILVLKRIDQTTETIDIKTAINVATTGGSTGDTSTPSSGGNSSGSGGGGNSCNGDCQGECLYTCSISCGQDCTSRCVRTCKGSCTGGCTSGCTLTCSVKCTNNCSADCQVSCYTSCSEGCSGVCTSGCGSDCTNGCTNVCGTVCSNSCTNNCTNGCGNTCRQGCALTCAAGAGNLPQ